MAKVISPQDFAAIVCELYKEVLSIDLLDFENCVYYLGNLDRETAVKAAEERLQSAPLDALILNGIASESINGFSPYRIRGVMNNHINNGSSYYDRPSDPISLVDIVKRRLSKDLYKRNPDVLKKREHTAGVIYPQSDWGFVITVNGNEVKQY
jgi:hypothetical protein